MRFRPSLFWDVDPRTIDPKKHARYVIERVLDFGDDKEARWVYQTYPRRLIHEVADTSRSLHPQTRALWRTLTKQ